MALQSTFDANGVTVTDGYIKVQDLFCTKNRVDVGVAFKANQDVPPIKIASYSFVPNLDGPNFIKQAYGHLKTLPEFAGAADV